MNHSAPQRLRRDVDKLDLFGPAHHCVRHGFALHDPGDLFDDVIQAFQVLHVDGGQHVDPRIQDLVDVLPTLGVSAARHIGVCHLIDEHQGRPALQHGVHVQLIHRCSAVDHLLGWNELQPIEQFGGLTTTVGLYHRGHHIGSAPGPAMRLVEHGEGLAYTGRGPQVDPQRPACAKTVRHRLSFIGRVGRSDPVPRSVWGR
ncbi:Uncharacterised protein [Mycobacteroides abscessus subsp. abscessus]|nr:Uncharacterised protein [Mycobacteroides abscessus subsp. abscessus]SHV18583.1 Uncharacterised protein [Mycobacteroides abscessus subsp. abscessus]SKY64789.1 Uncharacterised protein [Mycobacteroides abscessus subsp. abscessus]